VGWTATIVVKTNPPPGDYSLPLADPEAYIDFLGQAGKLGLVPKRVADEIRAGHHQKYDGPQDRAVVPFNLEERQELHPLPGTLFEQLYNSFVVIEADPDHVPANVGLTGQFVEVNAKYTA